MPRVRRKALTDEEAQAQAEKRREFWRDYIKRPDVSAKRKEYGKKYRAREDVKERRRQLARQKYAEKKRLNARSDASRSDSESQNTALAI